MGIAQRLYSDFFLPSRMEEYRRLIKYALKSGYIHLTLTAYYKLLKENKIDNSKKYFLHRHDIDTDPATARAFFETECELGVKSSYYFRLKTMDIELQRDLADHDFEVGYHYEELSDICKRKKIKQRQLVPEFYPEIRAMFKKNLTQMEKLSGRKIKSIAAHGDFVNRKIGLPNQAFITNELLSELGLELECYNEELIQSFNYIGSDTTYPAFYRPFSPFLAIDKNIQVIYFLSHPRHWRCNRVINLVDNISRLKEGIAYFNN